MVGFNYDYFKGLLDGGGADKAINYYRQQFTRANIDSTSRLEVVANLERDYNLMGASIHVRNVDDVVKTDQCVDHVVAMNCKTIDNLRRRDSIPLVSS